MASSEGIEDKRCSRILDNMAEFMFEHIDPDPLLDVFQSNGFLIPNRLRDIREFKNTPEKKRAIVYAVKNKGADGYRKFKQYLRQSGNEHVADKLEEEEKQTTETFVAQPTEDMGEGRYAVPPSDDIEEGRHDDSLR